MRVTRVQFKGYRRLADTGCNTDGKMIAFVGPNETGKTTVLQALEWFSEEDEPLSESAKSADPRPADADVVVQVRYWLEPDDLTLLKEIDYQGVPRHFTVSKRADGSRVTALTPRLSRPVGPFAEAAQEVSALQSRTDPEKLKEVASWIETAKVALADPNGNWDEEWSDDFDELIAWLKEPESSEGESEGAPREPRCADLLQRARKLLETRHPHDAVRRVLHANSPEFVLFTDDDRDLKTSYHLADEGLRTNPPAALENLRWVAELDLNALWLAEQRDDKRTALSLQRRANERLRAKLGSKWSQKNISVEFNLHGQQLEINIRELDDEGADTPFAERSEGLKTFITLVAFLARHDFELPPVLLLDEAETHLHLDAQADLIDVLTHDVDAVQVFYTTHSPGCLPRDLGTGIRLIAPVRGRLDASELRNDFWTSNEPGFTPLLFAMGAGAAAFSAFRKAVLAEGASEMILLPSLMRIALDLFDLPYQVAPGISSYTGTGLELEEVAARVVYLVDGDQGGSENRERLIKMGVTAERIFEFDEGKALEDYVDETQYLEVVNGLLEAGGARRQIGTDDLDRSVPIAKAVETWCKAHKLNSPGKTVVAAHLVNRSDSADDLRLAPGAKESLAAIHQRLLAGLS